jgi:serine O-acetyltransferase
MLASFYHATLLKHETLGGALSYILANKLATHYAGHCDP